MQQLSTHKRQVSDICHLTVGSAGALVRLWCQTARQPDRGYEADGGQQCCLHDTYIRRASRPHLLALHRRDSHGHQHGAPIQTLLCHAVQYLTDVRPKAPCCPLDHAHLADHAGGQCHSFDVPRNGSRLRIARTDQTVELEPDLLAVDVHHQQGVVGHGNLCGLEDLQDEQVTVSCVAGLDTELAVDVESSLDVH